MNRIVIFMLVLAGLFSACSNPNAFTIKGKIKNTTIKNLVLEEIGETQLIPFDSVKIADDGSFEFEGKIKEPKFFILRLGNEYITLFVEPSDNISIEVDLNNVTGSYKVEGSKGSQEIKEFNRTLYANLMQLDSLGRIYQEAMTSGNVGSIQPIVEANLDLLIEKQKKYTLDFIDRNLGSLVNIFVIHQQFPPQQSIINPANDMEVYEKVLSSVKKEYPENMYVKSFDKFITNVKQQLEVQANKPQAATNGAEAMDIALPSPQGDTIRLSSLRGKYVLLDFWAAWCRPCRAENPNLVGTYKKYGGKDFEIFQVSLDETRDAWVGAIEKDQLGKWIHVSDLQYWNSAAAKLYGVQSIPANYLIDPSGKIIAQNLRGPALGQKLAEIFGR